MRLDNQRNTLPAGNSVRGAGFLCRIGGGTRAAGRADEWHPRRTRGLVRHRAPSQPHLSLSPRVVRNAFTRQRRCPAPDSNQRQETRQAATVIVHLCPRPRPVDAGFRLVDLGRVGDAVSGWRRKFQRAALQCTERAAHQVGAEPASMSCSRRPLSAPIGPVPSSRPARCRGLLPPHHPPRRSRVSRHDGTVDRRRAAPSAASSEA